MALLKTQLIPMEADEEGTPLDITVKGVIVGREKDCEYNLNRDGVSRYHACFFEDGGRVLVEDLESTNGVLVNGRKIKGKEVLKPGDVVLICDFSFLIAGCADGPTRGASVRITFLLMALVGLILGIYFVTTYLNQKKASVGSVFPLTILSDPEGADVYDHGELVGETPLSMKNLKEGQYRLLLRLDGYKDKEILAYVPQGATRKIHVLESRFKGSRELNVRTLPSNAEVYVDGVYRGKTTAPQVGVGESEPLVIKGIDLSVPHKIYIKVDSLKSPTLLTKKWSTECALTFWKPDRLIQTTTGKTYLGMIRSRLSNGDLVLALKDGENVTIPAKQIASETHVIPPRIRNGTRGMDITQDENGLIELTIDPFPDDEY